MPAAMPAAVAEVEIELEESKPAPPPPPAARMIQILGGFWVARALHAVAKLGIADLLADGPKSVEQLAAATGTHAPSLYRLLRGAASSEVFREISPRVFESTPMGDTLRSGTGSLKAVFTSIGGEEHYDAWGDIVHAVTTGETAFDHHFGKGIWQFFDENPSNAKVFNQAMTDFTHAIDQALLKAYDFGKFKHIVDVGGGHGAVLAAILKAHPRVSGTVFDQPNVAEGACKAISEQNLSARCAAVGGDFFQSVPTGGDAYLMKFIIHDWDDEKSIRILKNIRKASPAGTKVLLVETLVPEGNGPDFSKLMDLNMLVMTGGRERTEQEYAALFAAAGFKLTGVTPTESVFSVIEAVAV